MREGVWGIILGGCKNILGGWRWVVMSGGEWCWVHCLIMPFFSFFVFV